MFRPRRALHTGVVERTHEVDPTPEERRSARFGALPPPPRPDELVETKPVSDPLDPSGGRDTENSWLIRYGAG